MTKPKPLHPLEMQLRLLLKQYLAQCRKLALEEARKAGKLPVVQVAPRRNRSPKEVRLLRERVYLAIQSTPGMSISKLATVLRLPPTQLQVPIAQLRKEKRIVRHGSRKFCQYYPRLANE